MSKALQHQLAKTIKEQGDMARAAPPALADASFPEEILVVLRTLKRAGHQAFLVGGSIRDRLLGKDAKDHDVATDARAEVVMKLFRRVVPTGIKHGTVTVMLGKVGIEVTTFRGEGEYRDGRRPDSVFFIQDIVEDLARRDFTINAMAYDPDARSLVDPFGGAEDLSRRLVRCVRDPLQRFGEDGLRPLRAVRFASVLGFEIEPATLEAIPKTLPTFAKVAQERIREELSRLLLGREPSRGAALLRETGLLSLILPEVAALAGLQVQDHELFGLTLGRLDATAPGLELRLAALLHDIEPGPAPQVAAKLGPAEAALERLRYPAKVIERGGRLVRHRGFVFGEYPSDAALRRGLARVGLDLVGDLFALGRAQVAALGREEPGGAVDALEQRVERILADRPALTPGDLALDGAKVMGRLGIAPGPRVGEAMRYLLDRVLDEPGLNTPQALGQLLDEWQARTA